jgi:membrane protease YdiL (CAAX protease family)
MQNLALSVGAGLFEEIIFRVILLNLLYLLLSTLLRKKVVAAVVSVLLASFLFSLSHYVGTMADTWQLYSFIFRWGAGLLFTLLYFIRGFAITAYTHALYDIWVLV